MTAQEARELVEKRHSDCSFIIEEIKEAAIEGNTSFYYYGKMSKFQKKTTHGSFKI